MSALGRCLVVGGAGFIGQAIVRRLEAEGEDVAIFDRVALDARAGAVGDLRDPRAIARAVVGFDTVFQCAAELSFDPRAKARLEAVNVEGNRRVLDAARAAGVRRLVYTSTVDVLCDGSPLRDVGEDHPIPARALCDYARTKAIAEREALAANGPDLATIALRPAGTWGPGDPSRLPPLVQAARRGQLMRLGDGRARFSHVYVDNVAHAHLLAARALASPARAARAAGRVVHVTDFPTGGFFDFAERLLTPLGLAPRGRLPEAAARAVAWASERTYALDRGGRWLAGEPALTRFAVAATCKDFTFTSAAPELLGYAPIVGLDEGLAATAAWARVRFQ